MSQVDKKTTVEKALVYFVGRGRDVEATFGQSYRSYSAAAVGEILVPPLAVIAYAYFTNNDVPYPLALIASALPGDGLLRLLSYPLRNVPSVRYLLGDISDQTGLVGKVRDFCAELTYFPADKPSDK